MKDQLTLRRLSQRTLGAGIIACLDESCRTEEQLLQRGLYYSLVDEVDNVLVDDAASPLILSGSGEDDATDAAIHRAAQRIAGELRAGEHYGEVGRGVCVELTAAGNNAIHQAACDLPVDQLLQTWTEYVEQALAARMLHRDVHYVVDEQNKVKIVDGSTGRIFTDRTWRDGLHQAVEAKEGVRVTGQKHALAQITRQRFSRLYERLAGMTGTAVDCTREFADVYRLKTRTIPLRVASRRQLWPTRCFTSRDAKWEAIAKSAEVLLRAGRPVLVGTRNIADSERLAELFLQRGITFQLLNGRQDAAEAQIIGEAGQRAVLTITTNIAGRGTDIQLGAGVAERGGLHVIVAECSDSARIDRQLVGRCARQGDSGSAQVFIAADDQLLVQHGPWLSNAIRRHADASGEFHFDPMPQIRRMQRWRKSGGR